MPERSRAGRNPYASPVGRNHNSRGEAPDPTNEFVFGGTSAYAVRQAPDSTDDEWTTGYASGLKAGGSPDGSALPDDIRTGQRQPPGTGDSHTANDPEWQALRHTEFHNRHRVELTTTMWSVKQEKIPAPRVPLWEQERMPIRPTATNSPTGYAFQRPWHIPRNIEDAIGEGAVTHFSMADHRRKYEIFGMKPQGRLGVNTYRASTRPWDENLYVPPPAQNLTGGIAGNRSFRL